MEDSRSSTSEELQPTRVTRIRSGESSVLRAWQPASAGETKLKWINEESPSDFNEFFLRGEPIPLRRACATQQIDDHETVAPGAIRPSNSRSRPRRCSIHCAETLMTAGLTAQPPPPTHGVGLILNNRLATEVVPAGRTSTAIDLVPNLRTAERIDAVSVRNLVRGSFNIFDRFEPRR